MDYLWQWLFVVLLLGLISAICFLAAKFLKLRDLIGLYQKRVDGQSSEIIKYQNRTSELQNRIKELESLPATTTAQKNSRELDDFLSDLKIHKYGVVRIDPDSIFYRGSR